MIDTAGATISPIPYQNIHGVLVGTGNTPIKPGDFRLAHYVGLARRYSDGDSKSVVHMEDLNEAHYTYTIRARYVVESNINVAELGLAASGRPEPVCLTRALITDDNGLPRAITVLVGEVLEIKYTLKMILSTAPTRGEFTLITGTDGGENSSTYIYEMYPVTFTPHILSSRIIIDGAHFSVGQPEGSPLINEDSSFAWYDNHYGTIKNHVYNLPSNYLYYNGVPHNTLLGNRPEHYRYRNIDGRSFSINLYVPPDRLVHENNSIRLMCVKTSICSFVMLVGDKTSGGGIPKTKNDVFDFSLIINVGRMESREV